MNTGEREHVVSDAVAPEHSSPPDGPTGRLQRRWLLLTLLVLALQLVGLYSPASDEPLIATPPHTDKLVHAASFAVVTTCALLARFPARFVVPIMLGHAVASELIQWKLIENRSGDIVDFLADAAGILIGVLTARVFLRRVTRRG